MLKWFIINIIFVQSHCLLLACLREVIPRENRENQGMTHHASLMDKLMNSLLMTAARSHFLYNAINVRFRIIEP
jgi:hypothetical protein